MKELVTKSLMTHELLNTGVVRDLNERLPKDLEENDYIDNVLAKHERFSPESRVGQYVQSRLDYIAGDPQIRAIVIHSGEVNAFATPGYVVITDQLLSLMEHEEELDAILAHEWNHLEREHVKSGEGSKEERMMVRIGKRRVQETGADLMPIEVMDERGINPYGFISIMRKMEHYINWVSFKERQKESETSRLDLPKGDPEHGSFLERRINLEQLAWLIDIRNLSLSLSPIGFSKDNLNDYQKDEDLLKSFDSLDSLTQKRVLERTLVKTLKDLENTQDASERVTLKENLNDQIQKLRKFVKDQDPNLGDEEVDQIAFNLVNFSYSFSNTVYGLRGEESNLVDWIRNIDSEEKIIEFSQQYKEATSRFKGLLGNDFRYSSIAIITLKEYIEGEDTLDLDEYKDFIKRIGLSDYHFFETAAEFFINRNLTSEEETLKIASLLVDTDLTYGAVTTTQLGIQEESRGRFYTAIAERLIQLRSQKLVSIKDPIEQVIYAVRTSDFGVAGMQAEYEAILSRIGDKFTLEEMIKRLQEWSSKSGKKIADQEWAKLIVEIFLKRKTLIVVGPEKHTSDEYRRINPVDLPDRFKLWAICSNREDFLTYIESDLGAYLDQEDTLRELITVADYVQSAPDKARQEGFEIDWRITREDFKHLDAFLRLIHSAALDEATQIRDFNVLVKVLGQFPIFNISGTDTEKWQRAATILLNGKSLSNENLDNLINLFALICFSNRTQLLLQAPNEIMNRVVRSVSFEKATEIIFERFKHLPKFLFSSAIDYLIEHKARTPQQFEKLEKYMKESIDDFFANTETIGRMAVVDAFLIEPAKAMKDQHRVVGSAREVFLSPEPLNLLSLVLESGKSDENLQKYLFNQWWVLNRFGNEDTYKTFKVEDYSTYRHSLGQLVYWLRELPDPSHYKSYLDLLRDIYLANTTMKYAFIRKTLTGEQGVLASPKSRFGLGELFISQAVKSDSEGFETTKAIVQALMEVGTQEELFDRISPVLMDLILKQPRKRFDNLSLATETAQKKLQDMKDQSLLSKLSSQDYLVMIAKMFVLMTGDRDLEKFFARLKPEVAHTFRGVLKPYIPSEPGKEDEDDFGKQYGSILEIGDIETRLLAHFGSEKNGGEAKTFTPWELAILIGSRDAIGVRMLQLAGQYFDVPESVQPQLNDLYDQTKGQSRLQAYRTLVREAKHFPEAKELLEKIQEIGPRIGGGSLMTVYEVIMRDGSKEAIAVKNPNVLYHLDKMADLLERLLTRLEDQHPNDRKYQLLKTLLKDVQQWLHDELEDPTFELKDARFRLQNDGWKSKDKGKYEFEVPSSIPTGTRWIRREKFIEGKNLTAISVTDGNTNLEKGEVNREEFKEIVSNLVKNYLNQIMQTGLVHSDIHPGNIRITPERKIAIFDRYNLIELKEEEKEFIVGLVTSFVFGGEQYLKNFLVEYLLNLDENKNVKITKEELVSSLTTDEAQTLEKSIINGIVFLKKSGLHIPLRLSLIAKNFQNLNRMAKKVGFNSLIEAYSAA